MEPIFRKQVINQNKIRTLTSLRDTLLPKLMSGGNKNKFVVINSNRYDS